jgi:hypothetical protein
VARPSIENDATIAEVETMMALDEMRGERGFFVHAEERIA